MNFAADPLGSICVPYLGTFSLPTTDAELLKSLQPHEVHRWTLPRIKECEEYLRTLRSVHNAAAPIHVTLPVEVIIRIFLNIKLNSIRDIAIMHVCRTWRTILLNVPEFFANLLGVVKKIGRRKDGNELLGMLLPLSGTRKLTVHEPNLADLARSPGILVPHLNRIRSLAVDLEVPDFIDFHRFLKTGAMPELEDLSVLSNAQNRHALADDLPNLVPWTEDDLPSLRRLDLISALFTQASAYPPLETLTLRHGVTDSTVHLYIPRIKSPTFFLNALSQCSRLRSLNLFNALPTQLAGWDAIDHAFVLHFPELRELYVYENRQRSVSRFLSHITSPPTASLNLGSNDPMFSDLLPTPLRKLMRDSMTALHFVPERSDICVLRIYKGEQQALDVRVQRSSSELRLPSLATLVDDIAALVPSNISDIRMNCRSTFFVSLTKLLNSFPEVKRLTLITWEGLNGGSVELEKLESPGVISRLLTARSGSDCGPFVCPKLEALVVQGVLPSAATLATGLRTALQTRAQARLKTLEVRWMRKLVQGNPAYEMPEARKTLEDALAEFVDQVSVDKY